MKPYRGGPVILALLLAVILMGGFNPGGALAQCGGQSGSGECQQHMNSSGHMGGHHMGQNGNAVSGQTGQATATPYAVTNPPASGYAVPDTTAGMGQMSQGDMAADHSGHTGN